MTIQYWLMKSEPNVYSIDDLKNDGTTQWEGVRNYQARNFMRDKMKRGDKVLFYHSNAKETGIIGLAEVCKLAYPDHFAWDRTSNYFDPKSSPEKPIWMMVDVAYKKTLPRVITLQELKTYPELDGMLVIKKGQRLSIQPVEQAHYEFVLSLV